MPKDEKLLAIRSHWMEKWRKRNCFLSIDFKDIFRLRQPFSPCAAVRLRCGLLSCVHKEKKAKEKFFREGERRGKKASLRSRIMCYILAYFFSYFFLRDSAAIRIYKTFLSTSCARARVSRSFSVWFVCCCFYFSLFCVFQGLTYKSYTLIYHCVRSIMPKWRRCHVVYCGASLYYWWFFGYRWLALSFGWKRTEISFWFDAPLWTQRVIRRKLSFVVCDPQLTYKMKINSLLPSTYWHSIIDWRRGKVYTFFSLPFYK